MRNRLVLLVAGLVPAFVACPPNDPPVDAPDAGIDAPPVVVQVIGTNDLHGALQPRNGTGGLAALAAHIAAVRIENSVTVAAGDNHGGSPLAAAFFHDEPVINALNALGLDLSAVGNHELDEGMPELLRMQNGGCHPVDGCQLGASFEGAQFRYLAANLVERDTGALVFPPYEIKDIAGVQIAFVGLSTVNTAATTVASLLTGFEFQDEATAVNALVPELQEQGADAIVVLIHEGGRQGAGELDIDACNAFAGRIASVAAAMDPAVKLIVSGHSHGTHVCRIGDTLVTGAGAGGAVITDVRFTFDGNTGAFIESSADNIFVDDSLPPDPVVAALIADAEAAAAVSSGVVVGTITADVLDVADELGSSPMGMVIADAMLTATRAAPANAQVALMNNGGIRASLFFARSGAETEDGQVTFGELFSVQPFQNTLSTVSISGADLLEVLQSGTVQFAGLTITVDPDTGAGEVFVDGVPLSPFASYRVTTNNILADATSGFAVLAAGTDPVGAGVDLDALVAYFALGPVSPPPPRVTFATE